MEGREGFFFEEPSVTKKQSSLVRGKSALTQKQKLTSEKQAIMDQLEIAREIGDKDAIDWIGASIIKLQKQSCSESWIEILIERFKYT